MYLALAATIVVATFATQWSPETESAGEHCVVFVVDQHEDGEFILTDATCFTSEGAADEFAASHVSARADGEDDGRSQPLSTFTLGKHYDGFNGSGDSITIVGGNCTGGYWNTGATWANRISSSYIGCPILKHWDLPNMGGAREELAGSGSTKNLTTMNNRAESISYHP